MRFRSATLRPLTKRPPYYGMAFALVCQTASIYIHKCAVFGFYLFARTTFVGAHLACDRRMQLFNRVPTAADCDVHE